MSANRLFQHPLYDSKVCRRAYPNETPNHWTTSPKQPSMKNLQMLHPLKKHSETRNCQPRNRISLVGRMFSRMEENWHWNQEAIILNHGSLAQSFLDSSTISRFAFKNLFKQHLKQTLKNLKLLYSRLEIYIHKSWKENGCVWMCPCQPAKPLGSSNAIKITSSSTTSRHENLNFDVKPRSSPAKHQAFQVPRWSLGPAKGLVHSFLFDYHSQGKCAWPMPLVLSKQISSHWFEVIPISSMLISLIPNKETSQISKLWIKSNCLSYRHTGTGQIMGWRFIFGFDLY